MSPPLTSTLLCWPITAFVAGRVRQPNPTGAQQGAAADQLDRALSSLADPRRETLLRQAWQDGASPTGWRQAAAEGLQELHAQPPGDAAASVLAQLAGLAPFDAASCSQVCCPDPAAACQACLAC